MYHDSIEAEVRSNYGPCALVPSDLQRTTVRYMFNVFAHPADIALNLPDWPER